MLHVGSTHIDTRRHTLPPDRHAAATLRDENSLHAVNGGGGMGGGKASSADHSQQQTQERTQKRDGSQTGDAQRNEYRYENREQVRSENTLPSMQ